MPAGPDLTEPGQVRAPEATGVRHRDGHQPAYLAGVHHRQGPGDQPAQPLSDDDRDWATAAAVTAAVLGGAHILRVHNVAKMVIVARVADALRLAQGRRAEKV